MSQSTDVEHVSPTHPPAVHADQMGLDGLADHEARRMWNVCKVLARTPQIAKPLQGNPEAIMGVALYLQGFDIPISLLTISQVHVWEDRGRIVQQLHYQLMLGLVHAAGHDAWLKSIDDKQATIGFIHRDHPGREQTFTYTMEMAKRAGLTEKDNWRKHPHYALPAAAVRMMARLGCPGVLVGLDVGGDEGVLVLPVAEPVSVLGEGSDEAGDEA